METQLWREMLDPYRLAVDELVVKFTHVKQEYQDARMYSPIESVSGRVKRISSILDKAHRKGLLKILIQLLILYTNAVT